jgi:UDP-N-acetylglucosamine 2-epimerase (non-hydrolysing)
MNLVHIVGARPNFMKAAPVVAALNRKPRVKQVLVHTGQHYDFNMSDVFFQQLGLPEPDVSLGVGSGSHARQTAEVLSRLEPVLLERRPDWVVVYGDVNSTMAAAVVCAKLLIPVAHVEAGLRSFDRTMPEEINRLITDQLADCLLTPSQDGNDNLLREGVTAEKIHLVGNVMIDTLVRLLPTAEAAWPAVRSKLALHSRGYALVTLHRPSNVDEPEKLRSLVETLDRIGHDLPVLFPIHPRTRARMRDWNLEPDAGRVCVLDPIGYLDFLALQRHCTLVITDSGGIQEETTFLQVPCITVRENTERPITLTMGTNVLVGQDMQRLRAEVDRILRTDRPCSRIPPLWDGHASERIANILAS